jgi:uncharacterized GH25 family protein
MSTITLRATKGSPLTNTEVDANFTNLNTGKVETADVSSENLANKVVTRDADGNFAAGVITASSISVGKIKADLLAGGEF